MIQKRRGLILSILVGLYLAALIWITLISRIGSEYSQSIYPPFWSFAEILKGNKHVLLETIENIVLFVPLGYFCRRILSLERWKVVCIGLAVSLLIECMQLLFHLGSFEVDDLVTNTIGAFIGSLFLAGKIEIRKWVRVVIISFAITIICPVVYGQIHYQHMVQIAHRFDKEDGKENLLILDGKSSFVGNTDVYAKYLSDGGIIIKGASDDRAWKLLGNITLEKGKYSFSGLTGLEPETIAIELEYYSEEQNNFIRLTPDVGSVDEVTFELQNETRIRAYIGVYPGAEGDCIAFPVIYRED